MWLASAYLVSLSRKLYPVVHMYMYICELYQEPISITKCCNGALNLCELQVLTFVECCYSICLLPFKDSG